MISSARLCPVRRPCHAGSVHRQTEGGRPRRNRGLISARLAAVSGWFNFVRLVPSHPVCDPKRRASAFGRSSTDCLRSRRDWRKSDLRVQMNVADTDIVLGLFTAQATGAPRTPRSRLDPDQYVRGARKGRRARLRARQHAGRAQGAARRHLGHHGLHGRAFEGQDLESRALRRPGRRSRRVPAVAGSRRGRAGTPARASGKPLRADRQGGAGAGVTDNTSNRFETYEGLDPAREMTGGVTGHITIRAGATNSGTFASSPTRGRERGPRRARCCARRAPCGGCYKEVRSSARPSIRTATMIGIRRSVAGRRRGRRHRAHSIHIPYPSIFPPTSLPPSRIHPRWQTRHLPLQTAADSVLHRMRRGYSYGQFRDWCVTCARRFPASPSPPICCRFLRRDRGRIPDYSARAGELVSMRRSCSPTPSSRATTAARKIPIRFRPRQAAAPGRGDRAAAAHHHEIYDPRRTPRARPSSKDVEALGPAIPGAHRYFPTVDRAGGSHVRPARCSVVVERATTATLFGRLADRLKAAAQPVEGRARQPGEQRAMAARGIGARDEHRSVTVSPSATRRMRSRSARSGSILNLSQVSGTYLQVRAGADLPWNASSSRGLVRDPATRVPGLFRFGYAARPIRHTNRRNPSSGRTADRSSVSCEPTWGTPSIGNEPLAACAPLNRSYAYRHTTDNQWPRSNPPPPICCKSSESRRALRMLALLGQKSSPPPTGRHHGAVAVRACRRTCRSCATPPDPRASGRDDHVLRLAKRRHAGRCPQDVVGSSPRGSTTKPWSRSRALRGGGAGA